MPVIDYFFSPVSPWVYLAGMRLEAIAEARGATISYHPIDPIALFARTGGQPLGQRHDTRKAYRLKELRRWSARLGLPVNPQPAFWPVNPAPSAYAIIAAARVGGDVGGLAHAFARATWAEDRDIADDEVIRAILAAQGFDPSIADRHMLAAAETYAANLEAAVERGAFGMPFYAVGTEVFWGQDRLDFLDEHLAAQA